MIYFDNAATTKVFDFLAEKINQIYTEDFGNPSSLHALGIAAENKIKNSRDIIARGLNVKSKEIFFTPSGSFSNNQVVFGVSKPDSNIVITDIEHSAMLNAAKNSDMEVRIAPVDSKGMVQLEKLMELVDDKTALVSIIHVSNELGCIQDLKSITEAVKAKNPRTLIHSDGVQAFGKIKLNLRKLGVDMYSASGHKINAPKGIGLLFVREGINLRPLVYGGGQEKGLVSGTENVAAIVALSNAFQTYERGDLRHIGDIKKFVAESITEISDAQINGYEDYTFEKSSMFIVNVGVKGVKSEPLLHLLESHGVYVSSGSACSKGEKSRILEAIDVSDDYIDGCIRISFDYNSTMQEAEEFVRVFKEDVKIIREIMR